MNKSFEQTSARIKFSLINAIRACISVSSAALSVFVSLMP
jgi:hypothetical protein